MIKKGRLTDNEKELLGESCPVFDTTDIPLVIAKGIEEDYITISDCYMGIQYRKGGFKSKNVKVKSVINDGIAFLSGDINISSIYINHDLDFTYTNRNHADCIHFQSRDTDTWKPGPITNVNIANVTLKVSGKGAEDKGHIMFSEPEINDNINMFSKGFEITTTAKNPKAPAINSNNFRNSTFGSPEFPLDPDKICNLPFRVIGNKPNSPESFGNTIHCYYGLKLELENPDGFNVIIHSMEYSLSENGIKSLLHEEGFRATKYKDVKGLWTIGVGHLITPEELATSIIRLSTGEKIGIHIKWTKEQVMQLLRDDLYRFRNSVNKLKDHINQGQFDALISFAFNIGVNGFERSTAFRRVKQGRHSEVPDAMLMWDKPRQIINRRKREAMSYRMASDNTIKKHKKYFKPKYARAKIAGSSLTPEEISFARSLLAL